MSDRLKLALIGAGPVAERYHLPAIRGVPEVLPWVVADLNPRQRESVARRGSFRHSTDRYQDFIGDIDLAVVALPNSLHAPTACELLKAGVHVLCEKPLARTVEECEAMLDAASAGNALLAAGHNRRHRTNVREAKYLLSKGLIGEVKQVVAEEGGAADWPRSPAYFDPRIAGGGALLDVGIHAIDLIHYLVGDFATVKYQGNQTASTVESEADLHFTLTCGAAGVLRCSRNRALSNQLRLEGVDGSLTISLWGTSIRLCTKRGKAFQHFAQLALSPVRRAMDGSFVEQLSAFVDAIRGGSELESNGVSGLRAVEVVQRAYRSADTSETLLQRWAS